MTGNNLHQASSQWATRPNDERYTSLEDLRTAVENRRRQCWTATPVTSDLRCIVTENDDLALNIYDPTAGEQRTVKPSHWAFGQLVQYASVPAGYLRRLPATLAAINLQHGLENDALRESGLALVQTNGTNTLRAMTSPSYGRIWDSQVVDAVMRANSDGRWQIPAAFYSTTNPKRATTLYASDRDVFIFLVDPSHPVEVDGEQLFRGFITWNSEVGRSVFGLTTFLYRYVCDNRIIWGVSEVKELRIRHTGGAPDRFAYEGGRYLERYANEATNRIVDTVKAAKAFELPEAAKPGGVEKWLQDRGFAKAVAKASVDTANAEEGQARSLWDIVNGVTAYARSIQYTDDRVELETAAGNLLKIVA